MMELQHGRVAMCGNCDVGSCGVGRGGASVLRSGEIPVRGSCFVGVQFRDVKAQGNGGKGQLRCIGIAVFGSSSDRCCGRGNYSLEKLWCERVAVLGSCGVCDLHGSCSV